MAETNDATGQQGTRQSAAPSGRSTQMVPARQPLRGSVLHSDQGTTTIADIVIGKIAGMAAREVTGVHELVARGAGESLVGMVQRVGGTERYHHGVSVEVGEREAAIDLSLIVDYGVSIPQVAAAVRQNINDRIETMTGLIVKEVNIDVQDIFVPGAEEQPRRVE